MFAAAATSASAQTKTVEKRTTETEVDSTSDGKVTKVETVTAVATSEDLTVRTHFVSLDPIKFAGLFNIGYQHAITKNITVGGTVQAPTQLTDASGFGFSAEGRFYPSGQTFRSFHVGGTIAYNNITAEGYNYESGQLEEKKVDPFSIGASAGWHWYPWPDFAAEFILGADYHFMGDERGDIMSDDVPFMTERKGLLPSFRFNIGYAW
jgi:hypothetical protein